MLNAGDRACLRAGTGRASVAAGLLLLAACGPDPEPTTSSGPVATRIDRGPFASELLLTGELEAVHSIEIKSPQTTLFQLRILFLAEEGSTVAAGDPLVGFDDSSLADRVRELENQILNAEIALVNSRNQLASQMKDLEIELAERTFDRDRAALLASIDPEVVSRKEYAERRLALAKAEEALEETGHRAELTRERGEGELEVLRIDREKKAKDLRAARGDLELLTIEAPSPGLVVYATRDRSTTRWQEGDSCWPGQVLMTLPDLARMQAVFLVSEVDAPRLRVGMPVEVGLDAFPGRSVGGRIAHIPSMAVRRDEESDIAIFRVTVALDETWPGEMKPGMSTRGRVVIESIDDAPRVPRSAVVARDDGYWLETPAGSVEIEPLALNATHFLVSEDTWRRIAGTRHESGSAREAARAAP